jgi:hypothetical protein
MAIPTSGHWEKTLAVASQQKVMIPYSQTKAALSGLKRREATHVFNVRGTTFAPLRAESPGVPEVQRYDLRRVRRYVGARRHPIRLAL